MLNALKLFTQHAAKANSKSASERFSSTLTHNNKTKVSIKDKNKAPQPQAGNSPSAAKQEQPLIISHVYPARVNVPESEPCQVTRSATSGCKFKTSFDSTGC